MSHYDEQREKYNAYLANRAKDNKPKYRTEGFGGYTWYQSTNRADRDFITYGGKVVHTGTRSYIQRVYTRLHDNYFSNK